MIFPPVPRTARLVHPQGAHATLELDRRGGSCSGGTMDQQARKARMEHMIAMEDAFQTFEELPLPERFKKLAEWVETHLSAADQAWIYQQWQHVLERSLEEPSDEAALSVDRGQPQTRGTP
jgi:hypothetical protein